MFNDKVWLSTVGVPGADLCYILNSGKPGNEKSHVFCTLSESTDESSLRHQFHSVVAALDPLFSKLGWLSEQSSYKLIQFYNGPRGTVTIDGDKKDFELSLEVDAKPSPKYTVAPSS
jgi:hypothetical protein